MTCCLNRSILNFASNCWSKYPLRLIFECEVWMVPRIALDADSPTLLGHSKNESPPFFGVKIGIGENQKALVVLQFDIFFKVIEDVSGMELFCFGIWSNSSADDLFLFQYSEALFHWRFATLRLFNSKCGHTSEEYFENRLHIVYKHFLEVSFLLSEVFVLLLLPHFKDDTLVNIPITNVWIKILSIKWVKMKLTLKVCAFSWVFLAIQSRSAKYYNDK